MTFVNTYVIIRRMDTKQTVLDLLATGITQKELADMVPCSQSLIAAFANGTRGKQPSMVIGNQLLSLHKKLCFSADAPAQEGAQ